MNVVKDIETAGELKKRLLKKKLQGMPVIGYLESVVEGEPDSYFPILDDEQIPVNVGISIKLR